MVGGPAAGRGRGGKFKKFTRGGGKHFSRDLRPLDANGNEIREKDPNASSSEEEEESDENSSEEEAEEQPALTREQRRAAAKARKEAAVAKKNKKFAEPGDMPTDSEEEESEEDDMPVNPNHSKAARNQAKAAPVAVDEVAENVAKLSVEKKPSELSRKEREALEAQKRKEAYMKRHLAGETDEARSDIERLKQVREARALAEKRKQAEKEEAEEQQKLKGEQLERERKRREAAMGPTAKGKKGKSK